jgi:transposase
MLKVRTNTTRIGKMLHRNAQTIKQGFGFCGMFPDAEAFVDAAAKEVAAMEAKRRRGRARKANVRQIMALIWVLCRSGMQWRTLSLVSEIQWTTVFYNFQAWSRRGLWRRLAKRLIGEWRQRMGYEDGPSALVVDSRSTKSAPSCGEHGIDGGKKVKGVKLHILVDKFGLPVEMTVSAANVGDRDGLREMLVVVHEEMPTVRDVLGDLSYSGEEIRYEARLAGVSLKTKRCGDKKSGFVPTEVRWVVERTFGWFAQWRRIAVAYERNVSHFVDFAWIAIASIVAARLSRPSKTGYVNDIC